eukprot:gnl/Spiro4/8829_TR4647_c0_g1_i1.p1 gnl/Spiro4/8829_TR4647_c0_g1~~gnl/Spiro4/8829_TR4647_c0_g1_i1.p1  ORF type:complete len:319 (-),score=30.04 gnl/Spiro4/8829_TR4647_c0_g1_i1:110-946(-)
MEGLNLWLCWGFAVFGVVGALGHILGLWLEDTILTTCCCLIPGLSILAAIQFWTPSEYLSNHKQNKSYRIHIRRGVGLSVLGETMLALHSASEDSSFIFYSGILFMLSHVFYIMAFLARRPIEQDVRIGVAGVILVAAISMFRFLKVPADAEIPLFIYFGVECVMVWRGLAGQHLCGHPWCRRSGMVGAGGVLFRCLSDLIVALDKFSQPFSVAPILAAVFFHLGQLLIASSLFCLLLMPPPDRQHNTHSHKPSNATTHAPKHVCHHRAPIPTQTPTS